MHVKPSVEVVVVGHLGYICYSFMGHLKAGNRDRHVSSRREKVAVFILEIFVFNVEEELSVVSSKMADCKAIISILIFLDDIGVIWPGVAHFADGAKEVRIHEPNSFFLEDSVEQLEHLLAQELVVPIHYDQDLLRFTEFSSCFTNIIE